MKILGISGSLRSDSFNTAALRVAADVAPDGVTVEVHPLNDIPLYNFDVEEEVGFPEPVAVLRQAMADADGLLIASPEYNYSMTGALKNAIDWASRGGSDSPLKFIPTAMLGVGGRFGTLRAQLHLREVMLHAQARVVDDIQVYIPRSDAEFDDDRKVTSERYVHQIERLVAALAELINHG
ncbi:MAG: NAD(P)H-dependent oxidoreductase [Acidimicrobiia bacterium]|nr:NAD(P)H-dependent oxidoreductase [Acidimicrobiia bacterium]